MSVVRDLRKGDIVVTAGKRQIADIDDRLQLRRICIPPELVSFRPFPGKRTDDLDTICHLVIGEILKVRIIGQNEVQVVDRIFQLPGPRLIFESLFPVVA